MGLSTKEPTKLVVIGGGNSGVEEGLFLSQFAERITLVEFEPRLKASGLLQEKVRHHPSSPHLAQSSDGPSSPILNRPRSLRRAHADVVPRGIS